MRLLYGSFAFMVWAAAADQVTAPKQSITVEAPAPKVESGATTATTVGSDEVKSLPDRPANVREALPAIPGVVRTPEGRLVISGGPEHRSVLLVNSVDVTDPATGSFGATVPIDIVDRLSVYKTPFLAEYGRFSSGVVAVETRRGGDKWHYELNDPTPELRIRSGHIRGVRGFTPRLSASGPVLRNRLWFTGAGEFALRKRPVYPLPFPYNEEKSQSVNTYLQLDWAASGKHLVSWNGHGVPQKSNFAGLGFYTPQPAAPGYRGHEYRTSVSDHYSASRGLLESTFGVAEITARVDPQGEAPLVLAPTTSTGNYFLRQQRTAQRAQWIETFTPAAIDWRGTHHLRFGGNLTHTRLRGAASATAVVIPGFEGVTFLNQPQYGVSDYESALFVEDGWEPRNGVRVDAGVRADYQRITGATRLSPRIGVAWTPRGDVGTTLRAGYGWFRDRIPLNVFAFPFFPERNGMPNVLATRSLAPRSDIWNAQVEQPFGRVMRLRLNYIQSSSQGLPVVTPGSGIARMQGSGFARSQQLETIGRVAFRSEGEWLVSYVWNRTRANLNEFPNYVGDYPAPILRPDVYTTTAVNIPHRFLMWGLVPLRYGFRFAPMLEWRTGFPYSALDAAQQYAEPPNSRRFPPFFSLDLRVSKDIPVRGHTARISFSLFNTTGHNNYDAVRLNTADPQFGELLGLRPRRFRLDFDWLF